MQWGHLQRQDTIQVTEPKPSKPYVLWLCFTVIVFFDMSTLISHDNIGSQNYLLSFINL